MITNHYGHTVNPDIPVTGVLNISDINSQVLNDVMYYEDGINLSEEDRLDEFKSNFMDYISLDDYSNEVQDYLNFMLSVKRDSDSIDFEKVCDAVKDLILSQYNDMSESYPDDTWLIGSWVKDSNNQYEPDKTGDYAAIVRESTIQVVWSKYIICVKSLCSPCYPGQCDISVDDDGDYITSEKGFLCYNLPDEFFDRDY